MTEDHNEIPDELISPIPQMFAVAVVAAMFAIGGIITIGSVSTALYAVALIAFLVGSHRALVSDYPLERFEVGPFEASHPYKRVTITTDVEIQYDEDERAKTRTVECAAVAEDGTTIFCESDTEAVGEKLHLFGLVGGDYDNVRSTTDHILAVSPPVREYVDEWIAAEGNDPEVKAALETEFETTGNEMDTRVVEEEQNA
jgi:hypothetical protein